MTHHLLIAGAGNIGKAIAHLIARTKKYKVVLADIELKNIPPTIKKNKYIKLVEMDLTDPIKMASIVKDAKITALVSCLPFFCNKKIVSLCLENKIIYFDLTEDIDTTHFVHEVAQNSERAFVPQCGLAPGFINIIANDLMQYFETLDQVKLRCGGLPINASNALQYAFTWSIDGLINEYNQPCETIKNGKRTLASPLENLEEIQIDGLKYEAFNTSGGVGNLPQKFEGKVNTLNYKSIRYPGHRDRMRFLMQDLKLGQDVETLKKIIRNAIPYTTEDVVIIYVSVTGQKKGELMKENFVRKYYPTTIDDITYSALQITTAASASAVINFVISNAKKYHGYVMQEQFSLNDLLTSPFKQYLKGK